MSNQKQIIFAFKVIMLNFHNEIPFGNHIFFYYKFMGSVAKLKFRASGQNSMKLFTN